MFEFHKPDPLLIKLLGPQQLREEDYVLSPFALLFEAAGRCFAYNNLTRQGLELPAGFEPGDRFSPARIREDPELTALMEGYFLKPAGRDETALYEGAAAMMRAFQSKRGLTSFVVLPTMACNARCVYCYEAGSTPASMDRETEKALVEFLDRVRQPDTRLFLQWFGGEPLVGEGTIDRILADLRERGIDYLTGFTTNGSLITPAVADKMAGDWHAFNVQITLDGAEETYLRRKNYVNMPDAYRRVLSNIALLTERKIPVIVRFNLDENNAEDLLAALADLAGAVSHKELVSAYFAPLYQLRRSERCLAVWRLATELTPRIEAAGFRAQRMLAPGTRFHTFNCMAADPSANILITPEGRLSPCQHRLEGPLYGDIWNGVTEKEAFRSVTTTGPTREKCRDCPFLPDCTAYFQCPVYDSQCREARAMIADVALRRMAEEALAKAEAGHEAEGADPEQPDVFQIPAE